MRLFFPIFADVMFWHGMEIIPAWGIFSQLPAANDDYSDSGPIPA